MTEPVILKCCPFCGLNAGLTHYKDVRHPDHKAFDLVEIQCGNAHCPAKPKIEHWDADWAVAQWNERA